MNIVDEIFDLISRSQAREKEDKVLANYIRKSKDFEIFQEKNVRGYSFLQMANIFHLEESICAVIEKYPELIDSYILYDYAIGGHTNRLEKILEEKPELAKVGINYLNETFLHVLAENIGKNISNSYKIVHCLTKAIKSDPSLAEIKDRVGRTFVDIAKEKGIDIDVQAVLNGKYERKAKTSKSELEKLLEDYEKAKVLKEREKTQN